MNEAMYELPGYEQHDTYSQHKNDADIIKIRLDTDPVMYKFQLRLMGAVNAVVKTEDGTTAIDANKIQNPMVNTKGLLSVMHHLESIVNPQAVQGNFKEEDYWRNIKRFHRSLFRDLFVNMRRYGIHEDMYNELVDSITNFAMIYHSRTVGDGERKSYYESMQVKETTSGNQNKSWVNSIFG